MANAVYGCWTSVCRKWFEGSSAVLLAVKIIWALFTE